MRVRYSNPYVALPVLLVVGSEFTQLVEMGSETLLWGHVVALLACVVGARQAEHDPLPYQAIGFVSIFRLVIAGMPQVVAFTLVWLPLLYVPLLPGIYLVGRRQDAVQLTAGWRAGALLLPVSLILGVVLGEIEYSLHTPGALVPDWNVLYLLLVGVAMFVFTGFVEELLFRGLLQQSLEQHVGLWAAVIVTSLVFASMHATYTAEMVVFAFVVSVLLGLIYAVTDSLLVVTTIRGTLNVVVYSVAPILGPVFGIAGV